MDPSKNSYNLENISIKQKQFGKFYLKKRSRDENRNNIGRIQLRPIGDQYRVLFHPSHQPIEYLNIAMDRNVHVFQFLSGSDVREVSHFRHQQFLRTFEVFFQPFHLVAYVYLDFATAINNVVLLIDIFCELWIDWETNVLSFSENFFSTC